MPRGFGHGDFYHGGQRLVRRLLPWARMGGDDAVRDYAERADVTGGLTRLESLVLAYWLDYASCQLPTRGQRRWIERNVDFVLRAVRADGLI